MKPLRSFWTKLAAGLLVAFLVLGFFEIALRVLPLNRWEREHPHSWYPLFIKGKDTFAGKYVTNPHFKGSLAFQAFDVEKPATVKRLFVLGSSAAMGWPEPSMAFSRYMQRALDAVVPGRYEIVNAAAVAYGSKRVLNLLDDAVKFDPDVVVIWCGNNEYLESRQASLSDTARVASRAGYLLRHSSVYRAVRLAVRTAMPVDARGQGYRDLTDIRSNPHVPQGIEERSPETDRAVHDNFRDNLEEMAALIRQSKAAGIFCTVPSNLADWPPTRNLPERDDQQEVLRETQDRVSALIADEAYTDAAAKIQHALQLFPRDPFLYYLLGKTYLASGRDHEGLSALRTARDLDQRPLRALSHFNEAIGKTAAREGMALADLKQAFVDASGGAAGFNLFYDYVHPNEAGAKLAAITVLTQLQAIDPSLPLEKLVRSVKEDDWAARNAVNRALLHFLIGLALMDARDYSGAEEAFLRALAEDGDHAEAAGSLGMIHEQRGDLVAACQYYRQAASSDPESVYVGHLARGLYRLGDRAGAREVGERLLRQGEGEAWVFRLLGDVAFDEERWVEALEMYRQAESAGNADAELRSRLGEVQRNLGGEAKVISDHGRDAKIREGSGPSPARDTSP